MDYDELVAEFDPVKFGDHKRIELPENISNTAQYFFKERDRVLLSSGKTVCISHIWGLSGVMDSRTWDKFQYYMKERGYSITRCRIVNLEDGERRLWQYCRQFGFVSAGGNSATSIQKLQQGDILFICRVGKGLQGCVACGQVKSSVAIDVWDIPTKNGTLRNELLEDGKTTYYQKFSKDNTDKAVSVEWIGPFREDSPVPITGAHRTVCTSKINKPDFNNLTDAFNISRDEPGK